MVVDGRVEIKHDKIRVEPIDLTCVYFDRKTATLVQPVFRRLKRKTMVTVLVQLALTFYGRGTINKLKDRMSCPVDSHR